jgi:hypothetical protein
MKRTLSIAAFILAPIAMWSIMPASAGPDSGLSYAAEVEPLIVKRCASCHNAEDPKAKLLLEKGLAYEQLVGRASVQVPALQLVVPEKVSESYLWHKLDFTAEVGKGMPRTLFGAKRLPEEELALVRRWIEDGALP